MIAQLGGGLQSMLPVLLSGLSAVLGLAVGYIALRGYLQSRRRSMLFIAVGFVLVFWSQLLLLPVWLLVPRADFLLGVLGELSQIVGLASILYGLWMPAGNRSPDEREPAAGPRRED